MRSKKVLINIMVALTVQLVAVICGLIVPRLIISSFGSGVNGLVSSISQFLMYIVLLESGVGGVARAALYKPLANKDVNSISSIIKATEKFFRVVAVFFIAYLIVIAALFPYLVKNDFSGLFTSSLVLIIGLSTISQYYFGISYQILLQADQKQYISSSLQIITMIVNTVLVVFLIKIGASIHLVKLGSAFIFVIRPILLNRYINQKYKIVKNCVADNGAIKQRWDGLGHHIAFLIHNSTDVAVLTLFANIKEVSVYSVYFLVVSGIMSLTSAFSTGLEAAFGNMIAKDEKEILNKNFRLFEFSSFSLTMILFTSTALLILPFVSLYTRGVNDVNYYRPMFAYFLVAAEAIYCIRAPYSAVILAAGHYKQTRNGAFLEAVINIVISIILVNFLGIVGVAIGTLCAMLFRTSQYAVYLTKNILHRSIWDFIKRCFIFSAGVFVIIAIVNNLPVVVIDTYAKWLMQALTVTLIASAVVLIIGGLFYLAELKDILLMIKRLIKKK